jgi:hypothetical protein
MSFSNKKWLPNQILSRFRHIIESSTISFSFEDEEVQSSMFVGDFYCKQGLRLIAREYYLPDGRHKYSFQVQDSSNNLIFRYDNEPHWADLPNFPFHKHLHNSVEPSVEMTLEMVFAEIEQILKQ